jgi:hypothetical protein
MADFLYGRASVARKLGTNESEPAFAPTGLPNPAVKYCAYNETRQRFLCANVEVADTSLARLDTRLHSLTSISGAGLWIVPIQVIAPTSVRVPLDLVYLDRSSVVLNIVESFPLAQPVAAGAATSVLALPAQSIHSSGTRPGDRLILCVPEEMKLRLQQLAEAEPAPAAQNAGSPVPNLASPNPLAAEEQVAPRASGNVIQFVDRANPKPAENHLAETATAPAAPPLPPAPALAPVLAPATAAPTAPPQPAEKPAPRWKVVDSRSWLQRFLDPEPPDPRKAQRETLSGLVAYFFTGGRPEAQTVRDISATGVFVHTEERWYPGTVVRITLTDQHDPAYERSLTLNAKVVRAAEDGVGFQFLLRDDKEGHKGSSAVDNQAEGMLRAQVEEFLLRFKSNAG